MYNRGAIDASRQAEVAADGGEVDTTVLEVTLSTLLRESLDMGESEAIALGQGLGA